MGRVPGLQALGVGEIWEGAWDLGEDEAGCWEEEGEIWEGTRDLGEGGGAGAILGEPARGRVQRCGGGGGICDFGEERV